MRPMYAFILAILGVFYLVLPAWLKGAATARCAQDLPLVTYSCPLTGVRLILQAKLVVSVESLVRVHQCR